MMTTNTQALAPKEEQKAVTKPERLFHEINLLHLEGHYFMFDPKAAKALTDPLKELEKRLRAPEANNEKPTTIEPHPSYGAPSVFAYKVFQAIIKKLSDYGYPAPESVSFGNREIMRLIGRSAYGGKDSRELVKVLNQLRHTAINCWMYNKNTEEAANLSLSLVTTFLYTYKKRGQISLFTVYLHPFVIRSINNQYTFCLNFGRMEGLEPISTALFKHVYFHFSNIYSRKKSKDFIFRKDYADICRTWLGGLKVLPYKAKILQEQLGKHLEALKKTRLTKNYEIEKNADGDGFNLIIHPGPGFFEDYEQFYTRRVQGELPFSFAFDENTIQKPQEIVLHFYQKLYNTQEVDELGFTEKETTFAASLLEKHGHEEIQDFIDYGLAEAKKTNFDMKTFGGLKKYYVPYLKELAQRAQEKEKEKREQEQQLQKRRLGAYDSYRNEELIKIRETMPPQEVDEIECSVHEELQSQHPGSKIMSAWVRQRVDRVLGEKGGILTFEQWDARGG